VHARAIDLGFGEHGRCAAVEEPERLGISATGIVSRPAGSAETISIPIRWPSVPIPARINQSYARASQATVASFVRVSHSVGSDARITM
jgi:hypothetical protein